jgi:hypothetical protein
MESQRVVVTASQLNRSAVAEVEFDHSHIAGGISKIQTADNVIGIFTSNAMRERGQYQLQLLKTRSSSGVGSKINLVFDRDSLRISDSDLADDDLAVSSMDASKVTDILKRKTAISNDSDDSAIPPEKTQAAMSLRAMAKSKKATPFDDN